MKQLLLCITLFGSLHSSSKKDDDGSDLRSSRRGKGSFIGLNILRRSTTASDNKKGHKDFLVKSGEEDGQNDGAYVAPALSTSPTFVGASASTANFTTSRDDLLKELEAGTTSWPQKPTSAPTSPRLIPILPAPPITQATPEIKEFAQSIDYDLDAIKNEEIKNALMQKLQSALSHKTAYEKLVAAQRTVYAKQLDALREAAAILPPNAKRS